MLDQHPPLDRLFHALADPTRLVMVERLSRGPVSVSQLAQPLAMSLSAVMQHLDVLEASGLVRSQKVGRVRTCHIEPRALNMAEHWISDRRTSWERRLDRLGDYLAEQLDEPPSRPREYPMTERSVTHATFVIERTYAASPARVRRVCRPRGQEALVRGSR